MSARLEAAVPDSRLRVTIDRPPSSAASYVLYWMIAARRTHHSFGLQRAAAWAHELRKPLLVLEPLRAGHRWAADRHHVFVLQGMADHARRLETVGVRYLPYVEPRPGAGKGLLAALAERAAVVVTDDFPAYFLPRMLDAAARRLPTRLEVIDGNGLLPIRSTDRVFSRAHSFRAHLQRELPEHLARLPSPDPLAGHELGRARVPREVLRRWPMATARELRAPERLAAALPIDHAPAPVALAGGERAGAARLARFLDEGLARYPEQRNHPDEDAGSGLSPYLHYGHVSVHQVLFELAAREDWSPAQLGPPQGGAREGSWGTSEAAEAFLDELVTWRELGINYCTHRDDADRFEGLPAWARATMAEHACDPRPELYDLGALEAARTRDPLWNAAQRQLLREGRIHNYLRMLWGKRIYEWSSGGEEAMARMIALNDRWAMDGRDPNSYSGIAWVLGRYDRAWGPERPIFGKLRYMSSANTRRKLRLRDYLARYGEAP
ncbi:cryptochrome/DNA photolyase family protein [Paraliomyxa miuraensis]|uniref:deoxyribodipyrimidine photolyase n=1 Tax=Paraliomyxa miuraensis TaxID=376150 RepID=UPI00225453B0|nr:deoxyribodipyrimidine photolyase [Paraliomyxa miuraensis]MCX4246177.1 deoxyribodipyrimidine photolyase [Paraliomyxa miuraensis]